MSEQMRNIFKTELAPLSKLMYLYFCARADEEGRAAVRYKDIAKNLSIISASSISRHTTALVEAGLITKSRPMDEDGYVGSNVYTIRNWKG